MTVPPPSGAKSYDVDAAVARNIFSKVKAMQITETYQFILDEGAVKFARQMILKQGRVKLVEPTEGPFGSV